MLTVQVEGGGGDKTETSTFACYKTARYYAVSRYFQLKSIEETSKQPTPTAGAAPAEL